MTQASGVATDAALRPLGTAEILDGAVRLVRGNFRVVLTVSVPVAVVATLLRSLLTLAQVQSNGGATFGVTLGGVLTTGWTGAVLAGLLAPVFAASLLGTGRSLRQAVPRLGRTIAVLLVLGVVAGVAETAGLVLLVAGGVWLWGIWAVAAPACTTEGLGPFAALGRSAHLVRTTFWRVWGIRALGWLLTSVLSVFVTLPLQLLGDAVTGNKVFDTKEIADAHIYVLITAIGALLAAAVVAPISAAIDVLLYTDLRMRKEGLDIVLGLPARAEPTPEPAPGPTVTAW